MRKLTNKQLYNNLPCRSNQLLRSGRELIACVLLVLTSCTGTATDDILKDPNEMRFDVQYPGTSRATETNFEDNDSIGLYIAEQGNLLQPGGNYVNNAKLTYTAPEWKPAQPIYWNNGTYDVYAYSPYAEKITSVTDYPFSVATDQTGKGYAQSDFLFAVAKGQTASATAVPLKFSHCMSRVAIQLTKGADYDGDLPDDATVYIHNTVPESTIDLNVGIPTKYPYGTEATITAHSEGNHLYAAIVVPQRLDRTRPLFEVVMKGVSYLVESSFVFRKGVCHTITLVISKNPSQIKIEIGGEIENWN